MRELQDLIEQYKAAISALRTLEPDSAANRAMVNVEQQLSARIRAWRWPAGDAS